MKQQPHPSWLGRVPEMEDSYTSPHAVAQRMEHDRRLQHWIRVCIYAMIVGALTYTLLLGG